MVSDNQSPFEIMRQMMGGGAAKPEAGAPLAPPKPESDDEIMREMMGAAKKDGG